LSALKELWSCYKDGSLQENIRKVLNDIKEVREVFNGQEIDVEVTIDEDEYRDACWDAVLLQMADRYKPTEESSSVGRAHRHSSCDMDLPRVSMTELAWSDWINVKEIYNKSSTESSKRRKAEKKVAELARELHILENEKQPLVSERIVQLQSELQRIQHEREEVNRENVSLKNKLDEVASEPLAEQELLSNQLDPLWENKPEELLEVFQHLKKLPWHKLDNASKMNLTSCIETMMSLVSERLVNHPDLNTDVLIQVMQENSKVLQELPWYNLDNASKMNLTSCIITIMTWIAEQLANHPDLSTDVLIQVMQENTKVLEKLRWHQLDDGSKMELISNIETMTTWVAEQLVNHTDLSTDALIQVMQENTKVLEKLPWGYLNGDSRMKLISLIETMTTWVAEQLVKHPDLSTDALIQVMQENTKVLEKLPWGYLNGDSRMKLISLIETMTTWVAEQLVKHPDLSTDALIQVMQENTKVLEKLPSENIDNGI
ncbi:uncharacterized protein LOC110243866, partial [Exaiptasia diaphana]|uniref:uncharacterized protein LOC110243866 n=1 Tax=Exaiptasia diaphana TaxID=2652724 RepID=UPI00109B8810